MTKAFGVECGQRISFRLHARCEPCRASRWAGSGRSGIAGIRRGRGTAGIVPLDPQIEGIENVAFNDFTFGVDITGLTQVNNTFQWSDNFSKIAGKHIIEVRRRNSFRPGQHQPRRDLQRLFCCSRERETGSDFADFLLGDCQQLHAGRFPAVLYAQQVHWACSRRIAGSVRPNLTLNYGLRWDLMPPGARSTTSCRPWFPASNRCLSGRAAGWYFPATRAFPDARSAPIHQLRAAHRPGLLAAFANGFLSKLFGGPGQTSIRAGYGVFYTAFEGLSAGIMSANPPYGYDYTSLAPPLFASPFVTAASGRTRASAFRCRFPLSAPRREIRTRQSTGRSICPSPACRRSFTERDALQRELHGFPGTGGRDEDLP